MPKVSVVIPIYGVEKYIERCAVSLFEQTLHDIEFVFVDDCTPDHSIEILKQVIEKYRPCFEEKNYAVRIERMSSNSGLPTVRRHGVSLCSGEYVTHCDSDDWVAPNMYELLYKEAKRTDADMVMCGYNMTDGAKVYNVYYHHETDKQKLVSNLLTLKESWSVWNKLCRRSMYDDTLIYPTLSMGEDMVLTLQLVLKAERIAVVNEALYNYFYNPESITNVQSEASRYKHWKESAKNAEIVLSVFKSCDLADAYVAELVYLRYLQKMLAGNLVLSKKYCKEWLEMFSEVNLKTFKLSEISFNEKLKFLSKLLYAKMLNIFSKTNQ